MTLHLLFSQDFVGGGMTTSFNFYWSQLDNLHEMFGVLDVNSLYPFCALNNNFPTGDCVRILGEDLRHLSLSNGKYLYKGKPIFGIAQVLVDSPSSLEYPFLPLRQNGSRSTYALCRTCALEKRLAPCRHTSLESRGWVSVYSMDEIEYALTLGYDFQFFEINAWENPKPIFRDFVRLLAVEKQTASSLPDLYEGAEGLRQYCSEMNEYYKLSGSDQITTDDLIPDAKKRFFFKQLMNSFLGKFAQKQVRTKTQVAKSHSDIMKTFHKNGLDIESLDVLNEFNCLVNYNEDQARELDLTKNCLIFGMVTAYARLYMHKNMMHIKNECNGKIFFVSTDSIGFSCLKKNEPTSLIGPHIGQFKREYENVKSFLALGSKNYSITYELNGEVHTKTKISGVALNLPVHSQFKSETYREMVQKFLSGILTEVTLPQRKNFVSKLSIENRDVKVCIRNAVYKCRAVLRTNTSTQFFLGTLPYGYKKEMLDFRHDLSRDSGMGSVPLSDIESDPEDIPESNVETVMLSSDNEVSDDDFTD